MSTPIKLTRKRNMTRTLPGVRIDSATDDALRTACLEDGVDLSDIVRQALAWWIQRRKSATQGAANVPHWKSSETA